MTEKIDYYNDIHKWIAEINSSTTKMQRLNTSIEDLQRLQNFINTANDNLKSAYQDFNNGGYVDNGVTLDNGGITTNTNILDETLTIINSLVSLMDDDCVQLKHYIDTCNQNCQIAEDNYLNTP